MFDTFELHPLPEAALKALRAAAVADGCPEGMAIVGGLSEEDKALLTPEVLTRVRDLVRAEKAFEPNLAGLMALRKQKQEEIYANILGKRPALTFPPETKDIREGDWRSETVRPANMEDRACENTHPSRAANMAIHGLNSRAASDFMDNEDSQAPLKANVLSGYRVIHEAVLGTIKDDRPNSKTILKGRLAPTDLAPYSSDPAATFAALQAQGVLNAHGRITDVLCREEFELGAPEGVTDAAGLEAFLRARRPATIQVRVRGLHLMEGHVLVDGLPVSAPLLDFAVFVATCHKPLTEMGAQPTLYLPKMESRHETAWWAKVFETYSAMLGIDAATIRSTTMIETITASMEKEEMNYALRRHSLGQNKGRYDYLFNFLKRLTLPKSQQARLAGANNPEVEGHFKAFALPDNAHTGMGVSFLEAYSNHTSQANLKRGFDSVGGMVTNIPTGDPAVDGRAQAKLRVDKTNEAWKGDAGGWSGHPAFSPYVREPFDIVRGIHKGFKVVAAHGGRAPLEAAIAQVDPAAATAEAALQPVLAVVAQVTPATAKEAAALATLKTQLAASLTLHVAQQDADKYRDGLRRFIDLSPPAPAVTDAELIAVPAEQHAPEKFTYAGLKQYLRLALFYTASFLHGTGCIALDGVFEDLATAEKARANVWQWLAFDQPLLMPDGSTAAASPALLERAMEEVYAAALGEERESWGRVCKSVPPMQPDTLGEKHFRVARKILMVLCTSDRPLEFIPDLAYPFLLEPVRADEALWEELYQHLETYNADPMSRYSGGAAVAPVKAPTAQD